nr:hypothetical protein [Desulfobacterales bacterium]
MYERSTDHGTSQKAKEVYPQEKLQVLKEWELCGNGVEIAKEYEILPTPPVSVEEGLGAGSGDLSASGRLF